MSSSLSELTPIISNMELTHLTQRSLYTDYCKIFQKSVIWWNFYLFSSLLNSKSYAEIISLSLQRIKRF